MDTNNQKLDKLTKQEVAIRELLEKLELDIKISKATKNYELADKYEIEELGLAKLLNEIKIEKIQLTGAIELEERRITRDRYLKGVQAKEAEREKAEIHIKAAKEFHRDGQIKNIFGLITLVGGFFFFTTSVVLALLIIACGFVLIYLGKQSRLTSEDEKLYAKGYTKTQVFTMRKEEAERKKEAAAEYDRKSREEDWKNEKLARAIAKEIKK